MVQDGEMDDKEVKAAGGYAGDPFRIRPFGMALISAAPAGPENWIVKIKNTK